MSKGGYVVPDEARSQRTKRHHQRGSLSPDSLGPWKVRQTALSKAKQMAHLSVASMGWTKASLLELVKDWPTEID